MESLEYLKDELLKGQKLSGQGSYRRRAADEAAVPYLLNAKYGLKDYVERNPEDAEAWRLLSQAEESLLNYRAAIKSLQKAIAVGEWSRKDLKKLFLLKEHEEQWRELSLSPEQLETLGEYLELKVELMGCNHTLRFTRKWLNQTVPKNKKENVLRALQNQGGFCDCEVLSNVID